MNERVRNPAAGTTSASESQIETRKASVIATSKARYGTTEVAKSKDTTLCTDSTSGVEIPANSK